MSLSQVGEALYPSEMEAQARLRTAPVTSIAEGSSANSGAADKQAPAVPYDSEGSAATTVCLPAELTADATSALGTGNPPGCASHSLGDGAAEDLAAQLAKLKPQGEQLPELHLDFGDTAMALRMFGAAPSPYLQTAQQDFKSALQQLVQLANKQQELRVAWADLEADR